MKRTLQRRTRRKPDLNTWSLFCGFGGETLGKHLAFKELGIEDCCKFYALNHWQLAVDTLQRNFPHALTFCEDIKETDAAKINCGNIDLLWASPSCTHHSNARGGKPCDEQLRSHPFDVHFRWIKKNDVRMFLMENVWEITSWGPILEEDYIETKKVRDRKTKKYRIIKKVFKKGTADPRRKGEYFEKLISLLQNEGYTVEWRKLNAADYGDPTTRKRFFLIAVKDGQGIQWPKPTHRDPTIPLEKLSTEQRDLPVWKSAAEHVIDWDIPGRSIYYRTTKRGKPSPLAEDTIRRIKHGLKKFGLKGYFDYQRGRLPLLAGPQPFFQIYHSGKDAENRIFGPADMIPTLDTSNRIGLVESFISKGFGPCCTSPSSSIGLPLPTITTRDHNFLCRPSINVLHGNSNSVSAFLPLSTVATRLHHQLMQPLLIQNYGFQTDRGEGGLSLRMPFPTVCTSQHHSLIAPMIVRSDNTSSAPQIRTIDFPVSTAVSKQCHHFIQACMIDYHGSVVHRGAGGLDIFRPLPTIATSGKHQALIGTFIANTDYRHQVHKGKQSIFDPLSTITTTPRHSVVELFIVRNDYTHSGPRRVETPFQPISTMTTKRGHTLCQPCIMERYPDRLDKGTGSLSIHRAFPTVVGSRMHQLMKPYFVEYYGSSKSQPIWTPLPTVTTKDRHGLVDLVVKHEGAVENLPIVRSEEDIDRHDFSRPFCIEVDGQRLLVDITLRMLEPRELARAMGFPDSFKLETVDGTSLNKTDATMMIGNACPVNTVKALIKTLLLARSKDFGIDPEILEQERREAA